MGTWTLRSLTHRSALHDTSELYGNHYIVDFQLRYANSIVGAYKEPPRLYWFEQIFMNDYNARKHWTFSTNMYEHNPGSRTLRVWARRYVSAYEYAEGKMDPSIMGSCVLIGRDERPVSIDRIGRGIVDNREKAEAVRSYLRKHGGGLNIRIDDIPSIGTTNTQTNKERLLVFECGVVGGGQRVKARQYLKVDCSAPRTTWIREFALSWPRHSIETAGLTRAPAPFDVSRRRDAVFLGGECW